MHFSIYYQAMIRNTLARTFSTIKSFGVVGAGQMGTGIAIVASTVAKIPVIVYDSNSVALKKS